jgi:Holliday junction resolvase RusA-like endonuclease
MVIEVLKMKHIFILPFPPTVNGLYGGGSGQKRFPSAAYKKWLMRCHALTPVGISQPVMISYTFAWPDRRVRDGQNYMKAALDYLVNQGVLADDNYNIVISETWKHIGVDKKNPRVEIEVELQ